jgi:hypothetical protein
MTAFVLVMMLVLAPRRDHAELAGAVALAAETGRPLFALDEDRHKTAAFYTALLFRESSLRNDAIGDQGHSHCAGQIYLSHGFRTREGWSGADLREDVDKCMTVVVRMVRESFAVCAHLPPEERLALYARGSCASAEGRRISRDRSRLARRIAGVKP